VHADELEVVGEETVSVDLEVNKNTEESEKSSENSSCNNEGNGGDLDVDDSGQVTLF
jgi:hypothetical protein